MRIACSAHFSDCTVTESFLVQVSVWPPSSGSFTATEAEYGPRAWSGREQRSSSPWGEYVPDRAPVTSGVPEEVRRFVLQCIDSVEQLEVLLLLHGSPAVVWSAEAVATTLYSNPDSITRRLNGLHARGLLAATEVSSYRYLPRTPELDATVSLVADTYRLRRVAVITVIASKPMENVRAFSDAFRLRKKDDD